jgi:hypothetical protein
MKGNYGLWYILRTGMLISFSLLLLTFPVSAGLQISGSILQKDVSPDDTIQHVMTVTLINEKAPADVSLEVGGLGTTLDGRPRLIPGGEDTSPYSARQFITLDKTTLTLDPDKPQTVTATIKIPRDVGAGGRYAMIHIYTAPKGGTVALVTAVDVPVVLTIKGTGQIFSGNITFVDFKESAGSGQPAIISVTLKNTGNIHFDNAISTITLIDASGTSVFSGASKVSQAVAPLNSIQLDTTIEKELIPGTYTVTASAALSNGKILDTKSERIEIRKLYIPPFAEVSITLSPQSPGILATRDGSISIMFPQGAVLDSTKVTLKPVALENVLASPEKATMGSTVFSVDGLSGLLTKDATMTVKYSQEDINAAGMDPSKLIFARFDRGTNTWSLMRPTLDRNAGTISINTNRFSIWAVMAYEGQLPQAEGAETTAPNNQGFIVAIVVVSIALIIIAYLYWRR